MGGANCSTILDESLSEVEVFGTTAQITQLGVKWDGQDLYSLSQNGPVQVQT